MRNSSLVEISCAENVTGLKFNTEAAGYVFNVSVGEHSVVGRRVIVRRLGRGRRENAGMSSEKGSENLPHRKPKVSWGRFVRPGLGGA